MAEWTAAEDGPIPNRAQAARAAQHEMEVLCRGLGRLGALSPHEVFPELVVVTTSHEEEGVVTTAHASGVVWSRALGSARQ